MRTSERVSLFRRASDGVVAIEFAMVAPVFLLLVFMIFEYSLFVTKRSVLRHTVFEASRSIQIGEIQKAVDEAGADGEAMFKDVYCSKAPAFIDCEAIYFDVRAHDSLAEADFPPVVFEAGGVPQNFRFEPGNEEQVITVRATVAHDFTFPAMREIFQADGEPAILLGYYVFKNEPFGCC